MVTFELTPGCVQMALGPSARYPSRPSTLAGCCLRQHILVGLEASKIAGSPGKTGSPTSAWGETHPGPSPQKADPPAPAD